MKLRFVVKTLLLPMFLTCLVLINLPQAVGDEPKEVPKSTSYRSEASGGAKFDGPINIDVGKRARITITGLETLNDVKIQCFPQNDEWDAVKLWDGSPVILFYPSKAGIFNFVVAGNLNQKTILVLHTINVGGVPAPPGPDPKPPTPPDPTVPDGKYTTKLRSPYMVSPDNASLIKLIDVYSSMADQSGNLSSYRQMADALAAAVKAKLGNDTALRPLKDVVADILQTDLANRNSQVYSASATKDIFTELAKSLKPLLNK